MAEEKKQDSNPIQKNTFVHGMMMDIDPSIIPDDRYFMAKDIRVFNKKGEGLIVTTADGNEFAFNISSGFVPIGVQQHKGILYVISCSADGLGQGEIGTYPSPNVDNTGFDLIYSPLKNLSDSLYSNFMRTILFEMNPKYRATVEIKDSYDGSVDIYFADSVNQLRVVNSGFKQDGSSNGRDYTLATLGTTFNLVLGTNTALIITLGSITTGGALKYGNYIFFIQYSTEDYNTTHFVSESGPVPIFKGINTVGSIVGGPANSLSDKKVRLDLTNVDQNYAYVRVGYIRYFSDYGGIPTYELGMIDSRIAIVSDAMSIDITGNESEILITEEEFLVKKETEVIPKSIVQIKNRLFGANYKKTNIYDESLAEFAKLIKIGYGLEAKSDSVFIPSKASSFGQYKEYININEFVGYFRGESYPFGVVFEFHDGSLSEAYPLNGVDMWNNLTPDYDPAGVDKGNYNGIFRFPNTSLAPFMGVNLVQFMRVEFDSEEAFESIMAARENNWIRFNVKAIHFVRGERNKTLLYQGLMMNVSSNRATVDQLPMTIACSYDGHEYPEGSGDYAGLAPYIYNVTAWGNDGWPDAYHEMWGHAQAGSVSYSTGTGANSIEFMPIWRGYCPMIWQDKDNGQNDFRLVGATRVFMEPDKYAFFSPDVLLNQVNDVDNIGYVMRVGKTITARPAATNDNKGIWNEIWDLGTTPLQFPRITYAEMNSVAFLDVSTEGANVLDKVMVGENGSIRPNDGGYNEFVNEITDIWYDQSGGWFAGGLLTSGKWNPDTDDTIWYNRGNLSAKYIGIDLDQHDFNVSLQDEDFNMDIVNLYKGDPSSINILDLYPNRVSLKYYKLGKTILISDVVTAIIDYHNSGPDWTQFKSIYAYGGDCFLQRSYFKQLYWTGDGWSEIIRADGREDDLTLTDQATSEAYISHGMIIGIVTENNINVALRSEFDTNSFYPTQDLQPWVRQIGSSVYLESFNMNQGYSQVLSNNAIVAFDEGIPFRAQKYITRIRYSDSHVPGSFVDAYRTFRTNNFIDYSTENGEIISINAVYDRLVSVQLEAINEHYIDERITQQGQDGTVLGYGDVLSKSSRKMSNFGSQHQWSIVEADSLYGIDWQKNVIWQVSLERSSTGNLFLGAKDLTKEAYVEQWINDMFEEFSSGRSDKTNEYLDNTMNGEGIVSGVDEKYSDIYFTFHKRTEI